MNRVYGIKKTLVIFALVLMIAIIVGCWYLTLNVPLTVIIGVVMSSFFNIFDNYIILIISESREKDKINKKNKKNYQKYKKDYPDSIKELQEQKLPIRQQRLIYCVIGSKHNFAILEGYGFIYRDYSQENMYKVEDIFIELLEEDLGGVDRY